MEPKKTTLLFKIIKTLVRIFSPKMEIVGLENLPADHTVIVGNHTQMYGPIAGELYMPDNCYTWCAGQMMHRKDVPEYAFTDFWSKKPKWTHPYFRLISHLIAPLSVCIFNNARTIGVYHDARIMSTFRRTVERLGEGANVIIMPESREAHNHIINDFQEGFIDVARIYKKRTGKDLCFVPMYIAPTLKKACIGKGTFFRSDVPAAEEKQRVKDHLMSGITEIAVSLPEHRVTPYTNMPKKKYPINKI